MKKRRNHDAGFKGRVALEAVNGERTVSELAAKYGVLPAMIHQWKKVLLDGAAEIFKQGGMKAPAVAEDTVRSQHSKIGTRILMDGKGRCIDNIFIERLWRSLKHECINLHA